MNWKDRIFKPKWQHRDPEQRRQAVAGLEDPELLAQLDTIVREDEDPGVRAAAAGRVGQLELLLERLEQEKDKQVLRALRRRVAELAAATGSDRPPLDIRLQAIADAHDRDLLERVAEHGPETELRIAALGRVQRQGFLGDRAIHDPDPEVRRIAASAIKQASTLQRVIDETRTRDKQMHQALLARQRAEKLAAHDPETVAAEAHDLCVALEALAVQRIHEALPVPDSLAKRWQELNGHAPATLNQRWDRARRRLSTAEPVRPDPPAPDAGTISAHEEVSEQTESRPQAAASSASEDTQLAGLVEELRSLTAAERVPGQKKIGQLQSQLHKCGSPESERSRADLDEAKRLLSELADARTQLAAEAEQALSKAQALLESYRKKLEDGLLHAALEQRRAIVSLWTRHKADPRWKPVNAGLSALNSKLRELRDWQHWSNDKLRKRLISEMEILPKADLHPDAMLDRIKSLQKEWKELEASEQIPGEQHFAAAPWMWRKFRAAGNAAFNAAKPFLEKRSELQDRHQQEVEQKADQLRELATSGEPDWERLGKALKEARGAFRTLGEVPAKARKKLAARLRKAVEKADQLMLLRQDEIEKQKRKLIRSAEQLPYLEDRDEAIRTAKQLQADWKAAGSLWRKREQPLWEAFRAPIDPLFDELHAEREVQQAERQEHRAEQQELCDELRAVLDAPDAELPALEGKVRGLRDRWQDIGSADRRLRARFDKDSGLFDQRLSEFRKSRQAQTRERWWEKASVLHELECAHLLGTLTAAKRKKLESRWPGEVADNETDQILDKRFAASQDEAVGGAFSAESLDRAVALCIQVEFIAGLPSPSEDRERRMAYQVERLAKAMTGEGHQDSALDEARQAEQEWLTLPPLEPEHHDRLAPRFKAAIQELYGSINATKQ